MADIPRSREPFPDGRERVCVGSKIFLRFDYVTHISVRSVPREVNQAMQDNDENAMLEFEHGGDPEEMVYIRNRWIIAVIPDWASPNNEE